MPFSLDKRANICVKSCLLCGLIPLAGACRRMPIRCSLECSLLRQQHHRRKRRTTQISTERAFCIRISQKPAKNKIKSQDSLSATLYRWAGQWTSTQRDVLSIPSRVQCGTQCTVMSTSHPATLLCGSAPASPHQLRTVAKSHKRLLFH